MSTSKTEAFFTRIRFKLNITFSLESLSNALVGWLLLHMIVLKQLVLLGQ